MLTGTRNLFLPSHMMAGSNSYTTYCPFIQTKGFWMKRGIVITITTPENSSVWANKYEGKERQRALRDVRMREDMMKKKNKKSKAGSHTWHPNAAHHLMCLPIALSPSFLLSPCAACDFLFFLNPFLHCEQSLLSPWFICLHHKTAG